MTEQIECVGGPLDGHIIQTDGRDIFYYPLQIKSYECIAKQRGKRKHVDYTNCRHIYHYDPIQSKYIYKGVEK